MEEACNDSDVRCANIFSVAFDHRTEAASIVELLSLRFGVRKPEHCYVRIIRAIKAPSKPMQTTEANASAASHFLEKCTNPILRDAIIISSGTITEGRIEANTAWDHSISAIGLTPAIRTAAAEVDSAGRQYYPE